MSKSLVALAVAAGIAPAFAAGAFDAPQTRLDTGDLAAWALEPIVLDAVRAQNATHAGLTRAQIDQLDAGWRAQLRDPEAPMIDGVIGNAASIRLRDRKARAAGLVTQVVVMDAKGLNVAQSDLTPDYWQGDEEAFAGSYGAGPGGVHVSAVAVDRGSRSRWREISMTVVDPATGSAIGAVTFGVDMDRMR